MEIIDAILTFFDKHDFIDIVFIFWPLIFFDFPRFVFLDILVTFLFLIKLRSNKRKLAEARFQLYREKPLVSIIVPGKNEGKNIPKLVNTLQNQSYKNFEIIVVDDGSTDETPYILRSLHRRKLVDKIFRLNIRGGKASAANLALKYATGKFIIHIDADTVLDRFAIENFLLPFYIYKDLGAVSGDVRVNNWDNSFSTRLQTIEYLKNITIGRVVTSELNILRIISGAFGAFRTDIVKKLGGWDIGPGLDGDITIRIRKLGYRVIHQPFSICYTNVPVSFKKLAKQRYRWNRSLVRFRLRRHRDLLLPTRIFNKNFNLFNTLSVLDNIFFNFILDFKWWFYIFQILFLYRSEVHIIFIVNYLLYLVSNFIQFLVILIFLYATKSLRKEEILLLIYIPLVPIYTGLFLRTVRTYSYLSELLLKASYFDKWNPWKVSRTIIDKD